MTESERKMWYEENEKVKRDIERGFYESVLGQLKYLDLEKYHTLPEMVREIRENVKMVIS